MRTVHILAAFATLALSAVVTAPAQAQGLVQVSPPPVTSAPVDAPIFEDIKVEVGTALPPKAGSGLVINGGTLDWRTPMKNNRATTQQIKPHR